MPEDSTQRPLRIALITTDDRQHYGQFERETPFFGTAVQALLDGFQGLPEVHVDVLCNVQRPVRSPKHLAPNIEYHSLVVPKIGWLRAGYLGCILAVRRKLRPLRPDIVHGEGTERDCGMCAAFSGFPNVVTIHGNIKAIANIYNNSFGSYYWMAAKLETLALRHTGGVFCNSAYTQALVAPRAKKVWRAPNALRSEFFSPLPAKESTCGTSFLNIGVVEPRKRQLELLAVGRRLHERGFKFEMQFAGFLPPGSDYTAQFTRELAQAQQAGYARHLGSLSTAQLIEAMDHAIALIHFPREEAFGLVVAEALARNLKLFGAACGGIVDIADGVDGAELVAPEDSAGLELALTQWLSSGCPPPRPSAPLMRQRYHPEVIARRHIEIYKELLATTH